MEGIAVAFEVEDTASASVLAHSPVVRKAFGVFVERIAEEIGFRLRVLPGSRVERNVHGVRYYLFARCEEE